jgi:uncharacterized protein with PQ loop repeat
MIETIGSLLLALCGVPEVYRSYKEKKCAIGWPMLLMWFVGEILLIVFAIQTEQYSLLINYFANVGLIAVLLRYKIWPKQNDTL